MNRIYVFGALAIFLSFLIAFSRPSFGEEVINPQCLAISEIVSDEVVDTLHKQGGELVTLEGKEADAFMAVLVSIVGPPPADYQYDRFDVAHPTEDAIQVNIVVSYKGCAKGHMALPYENFAGLFRKASTAPDRIYL